jgi:hypothetical protein
VTAVSKTLKPWRETLPTHSAAELTPLMTPEQLRELADDIKKNGMREPVSVSEGGYKLKLGTMHLFDGRNRLHALELLGVEIFHTEFKRGKKTEKINWHCEVVTGNGVSSRVFKIEQVDDPEAFVKSKNLHRLHLSAEQRREFLTKKLKANPELSDSAVLTCSSRWPSARSPMACMALMSKLRITCWSWTRSP